MAADDPLDPDTREQLEAAFRKMMRALFEENGAFLRVEILEEPAAQGFIESHAAALDASFQQVEMSDIMRKRLQESDYVFSGMKAFHELNQAFPSLLDENGDRKSFERFLKDVRSIDDSYNKNYLRAEYNFVHASAAMAARWEQFAEDADRYLLQYRTVADSKVRPEHAALHGVTLPFSDPFWDEFFPPNNWNCRCSAVQVLKSKYAATPHDEVMARAGAIMAKDSDRMFRFNPGKEGKAVPDYNPYTVSRCRDCDIAKGEIKLARVVPPDNELCAACQLLRAALRQRKSKQATRQEFQKLAQKLKDWAEQNLDTVELRHSAQAPNTAKRSYVASNDGYSIGVGKTFFSEVMAKNKRNADLPDIAEAATHFQEWIPLAVRTSVENGRHHDFDFSVYRTSWNGRGIVFKCKMTDGELLYNMTFDDK